MNDLDAENKNTGFLSAMSNFISMLDNSPLIKILGGIGAFLLVITGVINKYFPELIQPSSKITSVSQIRQQEDEVKNLLVSAVRIQSGVFNNFLKAAQDLQSARQDSVTEPSLIPKKIEAEQNYRRQNQIANALMGAWDNPEKGFFASLNIYHAASKLSRSEQLAEAENELMNAKTNLKYINELPDLTAKNIDAQEKSVLRRLQRSWKDSEGCFEWLIVEGNHSNGGEAEKAQKSINIVGKSAAEVIIAVYNESIIETVVKSPISEKGMVYRYTLHSSDLQTENLSNGSKGKFKGC